MRESSGPGREPSPLGSEAHARALDALLGATRAIVLRAVAQRPGSTTGEISRAARVAPATASHHTSVLRQAGLITTQRTGGSVHHRLAPLGESLLGRSQDS
ncbi:MULTISPECIES: ArsR/SmtB family transcription factor [Streptomyces]|uniref:ArsR/SmtB family transcription factor n=1 Tax=Streptomyces TaxID=1883 RepID=UPI00365A5B0E